MIFLPVFTCVSKNIWFDHIIFKKLAKIFMQMLDGFKEIYRYQVYPDFILLRMIDIGAIWGTENGHPFFGRCILAKKVMLKKSYYQNEKKIYLSDLTPKKNSESFDKNWWNGGWFLNLANFTQLAFFTLLPPSHYTLN